MPSLFSFPSLQISKVQKEVKMKVNLENLLRNERSCLPAMGFIKHLKILRDNPDLAKEF